MANSLPVGNALDAIGNTPCVQLQRVVPERCARVFVKLELLNATGSYKDRMAKSLVEEAERRGDSRPGMTVVETTGGSTGSSLAFVCAIKGYEFHMVSSDAYTVNKLRTMAASGAKVDLINSPSGRMTAGLVLWMIERAKAIAQDDTYYSIDQFTNADLTPMLATKHGLELVNQFSNGIDGFCAAVETAGMVMGVSRILKERWPKTHVRILEPTPSPRARAVCMALKV